ncbi:demethoxyubiquinone hydroxylase family protein [Gammaproteobacteria bacterium]|nr:demethoxyubiquinone hydroxylase family protein [Gammaproteobacteria bacterium]
MDRLITIIDRTLKTLAHAPRYYTQSGHTVGQLMRVNYAGEVAAQGLYLGAWTMSRDVGFQSFCIQSMQEEAIHLDWCLERMQVYQTRPSRFNIPIYLSAYGLGCLSSLAGRRYALGFVEETEKQVLNHLVQHQSKIPKSDEKTHEVISQMLIDESKHQQHAKEMGAEPLPWVCQKLMHYMGSTLTTLSYWV